MVITLFPLIFPAFLIFAVIHDRSNLAQDLTCCANCYLFVEGCFEYFFRTVYSAGKIYTEPAEYAAAIFILPVK